MARTFFRMVLGGLAGKVLGVVREVLLAALYGAGPVVGANRVTLTATMVPINFFTADALSAGFLPLYVQYKRDSRTMALALYRAVWLLLAALSLALVAALQVARVLWIHLLAPGLDAPAAALTASMLSVAALGVPFLVLYSLDTLVALAQDDVRLVNLRASFQSIGLIAATVAAYVTGNVALLAWGFTAPYVALWAWGTYWIRHKNYLKSDGGDERVPLFDRAQARMALAMFWRRLRPLLLLPVLLQGSIAVERAVGSLLGIEVVAATEYSRFIVDSLMALIAAPLGLAGLAAFARMPREEVRAGLDRLITPVLLLTVPLSIALSINSRGIVTFLYARGHFDRLAVDVSSIMVLGYALGIWAHVLGYTFIKVLNARGANRRVAVVNGLSFAIIAAVNLVMWRFWGPITLGVASTIGGLVMFAGSAVSLGMLRQCLGLMALLSPGVAGTVAAGWLLAGHGLARLIASCAVIGLIWTLYVMSVPSFRRVVMARVRSTVAGRGSTSPPAEEPVPVRSGLPSGQV